MREILFRGKTKDIDPISWIEGDVTNMLRSVDNSIIRSFIFPTEGRYLENYCVDLIQEVDPETVGSWTGLCDKNGRKIFEGDIVRDDYGNVRKVTFVNGRFTPFNTYPEYSCWREDESEVIGNIHDNPELLTS